MMRGRRDFWFVLCVAVPGLGSRDRLPRLTSSHRKHTTTNNNNDSKSRVSALPGGQAVPAIEVVALRGGEVAWATQLADVDDDLESRYLRAARSSLDFALDVPGMGAFCLLCAVLRVCVLGAVAGPLR